MALGLNQIGQISVNARDAVRAAAFYRDTLELKHLFSFPNLAFFDCGGVRLMLTVAEKPEDDHPGSILYFKVADISETHRVLLSRGVDFVGDPHVVAKMPEYDLWMAFFRDTEGNTLALMSEVRAAA